ncbi:MAG: phosphoribosyl-ATP pyrophosphohydrolase [Rickettsiaceae bacterium]|jgi:predicted house-cleaning noncanonical NTP pyrophosphatase (MazG superfamily)|nr:phosphoribosyl-ATP pyrophosphohydrolase [Rickettsiaceae bacterium]
MPKFLLNKIIRDKLLQKILEAGVEVESKSLVGKELIDALKNKLQEEVKEVLEAKNNDELKEELADVLEVLYTICLKQGLDLAEIEKVRLEKFEDKGGFNDILVQTLSFDEEEERFKPYADYYRRNPNKYPQLA